MCGRRAPSRKIRHPPRVRLFCPARQGHPSVGLAGDNKPSPPMELTGLLGRPSEQESGWFDDVLHLTWTQASLVFSATRRDMNRTIYRRGSGVS